jgi:hypothetical protein
VSTWVRNAQRGEAAQWEEQRYTRLATELKRLQREAVARAVRVPVSPDTTGKTMTGLPNVRISKGQLTIEFFGTEDLLQQLFELSRAIANDYQTFQRLAESS